MKHLKKVQEITEAMQLVIPPADLPKVAQAQRVAFILLLSLPGMPVEIVADAVKVLAEKPEILQKASAKVQHLTVQQSVVSRAWSRISSNLPWNS